MQSEHTTIHKDYEEAEKYAKMYMNPVNNVRIYQLSDGTWQVLVSRKER